MKRFFFVALFALSSTVAHADDYDPTALHDRGNQKLIGNLEVVGKVTANEIAMPGGVSIGGTSNCPAEHACVSGASLNKLNTIQALMGAAGLGLDDAKKLVENASDTKIVGSIYEEFTLEWPCTGDHHGAFGAGSIVVCGNDQAGNGILAPSARVTGTLSASVIAGDSMSVKSANVSGQLSAGTLYTSGHLNAQTAAFYHAPVIPLVRYGLEIHAEYSGEIPVCTEEQSAAFVEAIQIFIGNNLPEASLIAYECGKWFSIISPAMLEDFPTAKMTVFDMFDGVLIKHYIPNYYEDQGGAFQKMNCGTDRSGTIAVALDSKGAALVECRNEDGQGRVYRRYSPESTIQF